MPLPSRANGFTFVEIAVVIVMIAILAAIAIPNFIQRLDRAREGSTKGNMNTLQLMAEDYAIENGGVYSGVLDDHHIGDRLPPGFRNPFDGEQGEGRAWEDRSSVDGVPSLVPGIVSYADSDSVFYNVKGHGARSALTLVLTSGR